MFRRVISRGLSIVAHSYERAHLLSEKEMEHLSIKTDLTSTLAVIAVSWNVHAV